MKRTYKKIPYINLLPKKGIAQDILRISSLLVILIGITFGYFLYQDIRELGMEKIRLEAEIKETQEAIEGKSVEELRKIINEMALVDFIKERIGDRNWAESLYAILVEKPQDLELRSISEKGGDIVIEGYAGKYESLMKYVSTLSKELKMSPILESEEKGNIINFKLDLKGAP